MFGGFRSGTMSALCSIDAVVGAAEACERAAVALKRSCRDVEASARGFGFESNALLRARQLCGEVARLASRVDASLTEAEDAAALDADHDTPFLTPAEDRAATRERLASAPAEPIHIRLVRYSKGLNPPPSIPFLFHRRRVSGDVLSSNARVEREIAMHELLLDAKEKLNSPTAVHSLYSSSGEKILDVHQITQNETYVAKMASDLSPGLQLKNSVISRLTSVNTARDVSRAAPRFAVDAAAVSKQSRPATAHCSSTRKRSDFFNSLAQPKEVWVRSFVLKVKAYGGGGVDSTGAFTATDTSTKNPTLKLLSMRLPERGLEGMSLLSLKRRVALLVGYREDLDLKLLTLRLSPGKTLLRHPAELHPGCSLVVILEEDGLTRMGKQSKQKQSKQTRPSSVPVSGSKNSNPNSPMHLEFAPSSPAGKATRARVTALQEEGVLPLHKSMTKAQMDIHSKSSPRNPYGVDTLSFSDGGFGFQSAANSPKPTRRPDRFPMRKLTQKDLRHAIPTLTSKKPVVGEYCFGSRIRFEEEMLPPTRKLRLPGDVVKKKKKKKVRKVKNESVKTVDEEAYTTPGKENHTGAVDEPQTLEHVSPKELSFTRMPPKTPIWEAGQGRSEIENLEEAKQFFDSLSEDVKRSFRGVVRGTNPDGTPVGI